MDYEKEIAKKKAELLLLEQELAELKAMSPERMLAIALHDSQCGWNHTDGCGWFYEFDNGQHLWERSAHKSYLSKARKVAGMLPDFTAEQIVSVANALRGL